MITETELSPCNCALPRLSVGDHECPSGNRRKPLRGIAASAAGAGFVAASDPFRVDAQEVLQLEQLHEDCHAPRTLVDQPPGRGGDRGGQHHEPATSPQDAGHLEIQEFLLKLARSTGRTATFELPTRPTDPARSVDICVRDPRRRVLIIEEAWNTFGDLGAAIRSTHRKEAEAADLAATIDNEQPYRVAVVWVIRASAANRALIANYPEIVRSAFPGSSRDWVKSMTSGDAPPDRPALVWYDPPVGRIHEWRTAGTHARPY